MQSLDYDLAQGGWVFIYDPDLMPTELYHPDGGFNFGRSKNEAAIALIEAGRKEVDLEKRRAIYWKLEQVLYNSCEDAWFWWEETATAYRQSVQGWNQRRFPEIQGCLVLVAPALVQGRQGVSTGMPPDGD